jgi:hypothetical protein
MKLTHLLSAGILVSAMAATAMTAPTVPDPASGGSNMTAGNVPLTSVRADRLAGNRSWSSSSDHDGATVIRGFPCGIPVPGIGQVATTSSHSVVTPSGNAALSCHASTPIVVPQTLVFKDLPCGTFGSAGTDSHLVVTDTGRVNFWCHHHK